MSGGLPSISPDTDPSPRIRPERRKPGMCRRIGWVCAALLSLLWGCSLWTDRTPPDELIGVWQTDAARYKDCPTEITPTRIIFHTVTGAIDINTIQEIEKTTEKGKTLYRIHYENAEGLVYRLSFYFLQSPEGSVIQYKNQPQLIWKKRK